MTQRLPSLSSPCNRVGPAAERQINKQRRWTVTPCRPPTPGRRRLGSRGHGCGRAPPPSSRPSRRHPTAAGSGRAVRATWSRGAQERKSRVHTGVNGLCNDTSIATQQFLAFLVEVMYVCPSRLNQYNIGYISVYAQCPPDPPERCQVGGLLYMQPLADSVQLPGR